MTRNQIEYWKTQNEKAASERMARIQRRYNDQMAEETRRANLARERETHRANTINFALQKARDEAQKNHWDWSRAETAAHNRETERLTAIGTEYQKSYQEQMLQNERERINLGYYQSASNLEGTKYAAGAQYANVAMMDRANIARQEEINRANLVNEALQSQAQHTAKLQAYTGMQNAATNAQNAATRARELNLEATKWNVGLLPKTQAETELLGQQALTSSAQRDRWGEQSHVERVNAFSNVLHGISTFIPKGASK